MKTWSIEIRPIISQEIEAETWEEAREKLRETFEEQPWELEDIDDCEIHDVTPPDEQTQAMLDRLEKVIKLIEIPMYPDGIDVENVNFKDENYYDDEPDPEDNYTPKYVYADICFYDGCGGRTIEQGVEYDVEKLFKLEKEWERKKKK